MITKVNALGDACPIPVVKTKNAIRELNGAGIVETLVDNEIAVQNLTKMANQKGYGVKSEKIADNQFRVTMEISETAAALAAAALKAAAQAGTPQDGTDEECLVTSSGKKKNIVLFYNGGASLTCEGSASIEDLKSLEALGVEILTCGTCLNYYKLSEKLAVGGVTNMYEITERLTKADLVVRP